MKAVLLLALGALSWAAPSPRDPLAPVREDMRARGFRLREVLERGRTPFPLSAAIYDSAEKGSRLEVYAVVGGRAVPVWMHPAASERLDLDASFAGKGRLDLLGDGSRSVAYHSTIPALRARTLHIVRVSGLKAELAGEFPEGRLEEEEGGLRIVSRTLPLGRFLDVGCEDFATVSRSAFKTSLHAPRRGRFADVSGEHPAFYEREIARKEAELKRLKATVRENAGEFLGLALSLYFDHAALGRAAQGWSKASALLELPAYAPPKARACAGKILQDLRGRLDAAAKEPEARGPEKGPG